MTLINKVGSIFGKIVLLGAVLSVVACKATGPSGGASVEKRRADQLASVFEEGCLKSQQSMRAAFRVFDENGIRYRVPYTSRSNGTGPAHASIRISSDVPSPEFGDSSWDTRLLTCSLSRPGLFGAAMFPSIKTVLSRQGFRAVTPLPAFGVAKGAVSEGVYVRNGERFKVALYERRAGNPSVRRSGDVVYVRGNSITVVEFDSLSEPRRFKR